MAGRAVAGGTTPRAMWSPPYSALVRATSAATSGTSVTPEVECPALQMSRQRFGRASRAAMSMSLAISIAPRAGRSSGSRPAATGDHELASVPQQHLEVCGEARVGAMHDQVRACGGCIRVAQAGLDLEEPMVELVGRPAVHGRKGADHTASA